MPHPPRPQEAVQVPPAGLIHRNSPKTLAALSACLPALGAWGYHARFMGVDKITSRNTCVEASATTHKNGAHVNAE
eukprot:4805346-Ditylum_brightwellii.AAC.1